jgi:malate dehydrogenase (quinone)
MEIKVTDLSSSQREKIYTKFVYRCWWRFLTTVRKADVQGKGYGGFLSGQWLKCTNPEVIAKHEAKVCMEKQA